MKKWIVAVVVVWALVIVSGIAVGIVLVTGDDDKDSDNGANEESTSASPSESGSTSEPADGSVPPGLETFYGQQVTWEACGGNQCGVLEVPLDYADPTGDTIEIALEMAPATGDRIGSMVVNPGGPGAPGTSTAEDADFYFAPDLRARFDIVGFDPRGTGDSSPVDCFSDAELDAYIAADPDPDNRREVRDFVEVQEDFWEGCEEKSGDLGSHVSTIEAARDMDVLRAVLGEEKLPYFGFSYGTRLGATYAELFPENVGRFVLDGAVDPSLPTLEGSLSQAEGFETALRAYLENCVDGGDCFLGDSVDEGLRTISDLLAEIDAEPLPTSDERDLTVGNAFYGLVTPLYSEDNWPYLDQGLEEALAGNGDTLLLLSDFYGSRENDTYTDNSLEAISVINCLDDPWSIAVDEVPTYFDEFEEASPTFGAVFAWSLVSCHGTPFETTEPEIEIDADGADPIVVIGTTRDPATPYEEAVAMAEQLVPGVLLSRDGDGHTAYNKGNACIDDAVHAYFIDGTVPPDGTEC
ncbi:alpha/beta hydrolase [Nocardioides pelophilus]|uniref:alpha/beta hydrolase n=1 Tax=Nocardioides pelophilus TaxID=2172019 RepID=UPI0015FF4675|nr:alpha/beta hydrolase [Nocardioides pelophilus]